MFGPKGDKVTRNGGDFVKRSFIICARQQLLFGRSTQEDEMGGAFDTYGGEKRFRQGSGGET
jgi:hypothetical protein